MSDTADSEQAPEAEKFSQNRWTQVAASKLTSAFHREGLPGAYAAFPEVDRGVVDAKLDQLGLTALSAPEKENLDKALHPLLKHRDPKKALAYIRSQASALLAELNKPKRDRGDL